MRQSKLTNIRKAELCDLYSEALGDFKKFFENMKKALREKNGKTQKKAEPE
jgi:hypothetical protein